MEKRRSFIKKAGIAGLGISALPQLAFQSIHPEDLWFKISLAEWSYNKEIKSGEMTNLDFPVVTREKWGLDAVEYVNQLFMDKAQDMTYLKELNSICDSNGVKSLLIMVDNEGDLGSPEKKLRKEAIENHKKWVDAAKFLGCHSIRVNAHIVDDNSNAEEIAKYSTDGLRGICEYAAKSDINVIVENHGGWSSDGEWLVNVIKKVGMENCGTLPDFGNNCIKGDDAGICEIEMDRYKNTDLLMPYAKGVSAKSFNFDADGNETKIDYKKILKIVKDHGYTGYIGIEYEGDNAEVGIGKTKDLLIKAGGMV